MMKILLFTNYNLDRLKAETDRQDDRLFLVSKSKRGHSVKVDSKSLTKSAKNKIKESSTVEKIRPNSLDRHEKKSRQFIFNFDLLCLK